MLEKKYIALEFYHQKKNDLIELNRQKNTIEMEIIKYQQEQIYVIDAPIDGYVSTILFTEGQFVSLAKPLLKILPSKSDLIAHLLIPVNQSGFIDKNSKIFLRYDAYPYKRFGNYSAVIQTIDESILTDAEDEKFIQLGQPYYRATAKLDSQYVSVYGHPKKLHQGATFTAVVAGSKRKIWQWILDPIFSIYGEGP